MRIYIKILMLMLIVGLLPLILIGGFSFFSVERTVRNTAHQALTTIAMETGYEVLRMVREGYLNVLFLAQNPVITSTTTSRQEQARELKKSQLLYHIFKDLALINTKGQIRASVFYSFRGNWKYTSWFKSALGGKTVVSEIHADPHPFDVVITVATPVKDISGNIVGVLVGQLSMDVIEQIARGISIGKTSEVFIVDEHGNVVAGPDTSQSLDPIEYDSIRAAAVRKERGVTTLKDDDGEKIAVHVPIILGAYDRLLGWSIVILQSKKEAYAPLYVARYALLVAVIACFVVVNVLSFFLSRRISKRINGLVGVTRVLGRSDFSERVGDVGDDEIGELGSAINWAREQLATAEAESKQAEEERKRLEAQLQHAQKMEAVGTLAGGIAHDFNNVLMGIQGRISLMSVDTRPDDPHSRHLRAMEDAATRGANLTRQLLGFARGGKYEVRATDLNDLVGKSSEMFGRTRKEIRIHEKYQKDIWAVEVDRGQIEQVLLNLYVNAWQAMPEGGDLYVETQNITLDKRFTQPLNIEPGNYVKTSFRDTGVGMDEASRKRVFEPFFTTREMGGGTGLGLASAYGIVKNHAGMITVYSELGHGTTFDIYLPASDREVTEEEAPAVGVLSGTETVLLVDDEDTILAVGEEMLTELGYKVILARSGKEAIDVYSKHKDEADLVILDMIMPGMGGGETYDRLKQINSDIKALLSSGYSIDGKARKIMHRGCDGFIQKPFTLKQLSSKLRQILDK